VEELVTGFMGLAFLTAALTLPRGCHRFTIRQARVAAMALNVDITKQKFTLRDLRNGMNVEREHFDITGCDPIFSGKIALAHLREKPNYYTLLRKYVE
jgi:hypothetical protein